jgi:hypothetical protein
MSAQIYQFDPDHRLRKVADLTLENLKLRDDFETSTGRLNYPPKEDRTYPYAGLKPLQADLIDKQLYAAIPGTGTSTEDAMTKRGFYMLKYPAGTLPEDIERTPALGLHFQDEGQFRRRFAPLAKPIITQGSVKALNRIFAAAGQASLASDTFIPVYKRLSRVELCTSGGLYAETPGSLRFLIAKDDVVFHHPESFPELLSNKLARVRLDYA